MQTVVTADDLRAGVQAQRVHGRRVAFVPTMGNLHDGHLALVQRARKIADVVVVSVFVNPMQFAPGEDYATYPRSLDSDSTSLRQAGADILFAPDVSVIYPQGIDAVHTPEVPAVGNGLEAEFRPGFFRGVAVVVERLFELVQPDVVVFGEKDYQQLAVVRAMAAARDWRFDIVGVPTVREADGLAMSSRNRYLTPDERAIAPGLYRLISAAAEAVRQGARDYAAIEQQTEQALAEAGFKPDYVRIRDAGSLQPVADGGRAGVVLAAAWLGRARLIDNVVI